MHGEKTEGISVENGRRFKFGANADKVNIGVSLLWIWK
jgi:hypothetical protein